jgi:hypothetical protein
MHALRISEPVRVVRHLDLVVLALALPVFLLVHLPPLGWAAAAVGWCAQRVIDTYAKRRAAASGDPRTVAGVMTGSMIGRGWLVALTIFAAGLVQRRAGLSAAVLAIALFTIYFTVQLIVRPFEEDR